MVIRLAKKIIKRTFLYKLIQLCRVRRSTSCLTQHDWEMVKFYSKFIKRGDLCFDIGAHMGNRTKIFSYLGAIVVAVEPQDLCVDFLKKAFFGKKNVKIIKKALGEREGQGEILISNEHTLSSLSNEWIERVKESGRFSEYTWERKQPVQITTLDRLIDEYGIPSFIKIDAEGYEYEIIKGLTKPVRTISLEFIPEYIEPAFKCINYLSTLGKIQINYSLGESMVLELPNWTDNPEEIIKVLTEYRESNMMFGDVYITFKNNYR